METFVLIRLSIGVALIIIGKYGDVRIQMLNFCCDIYMRRGEGKKKHVKKFNKLTREFIIILRRYLWQYKYLDFREDIKTEFISDEKCLGDEDVIEVDGSNKNREYILSGKVYKETNNSIKYVRQTGIDKVRYSEPVLKPASEKGKITRSDVAELLQITPPQAYRIIQKLIKDDKLELVGSGRNSSYVIKHNQT